MVVKRDVKTLFSGEQQRRCYRSPSLHNGTCNSQPTVQKDGKQEKKRSISIEQISGAAQFCDAITIS